MKSNTIAVRYKGGVFAPLRPVPVARQYTEGELYFFKPDNKRYWPRHQHFMATIREAWENLPEKLQEELPHPDILRKRLLIASGYADIRSIVCGSEAEAHRFAAFVRPSIDNYSIMSVQGTILVIATPKSQAIGSMDADTFKKSCEDVQDHLALLLSSQRVSP